MLFKRRRTQGVQQHAKTRGHQRALMHWIDQAPSASKSSQCESESQVGPPKEQWEKNLKGLRTGKSARDGTAPSDRVSAMRWVVTEAQLQSLRLAVKTCRCLVLMRDERQGKLCVRFRATQQDMSLVNGLLGIIELEGKIANHLVHATHRAIEIFCTENFQPPRGVKLQLKNKVDKNLMQVIHNKCTMVVTDCAANELLAQQLSRGQRGGVDVDMGDGLTSLFPNARIIGRDRAHACQRLIERPWNACPTLKAILEDRKCAFVFVFSFLGFWLVWLNVV